MSLSRLFSGGASRRNARKAAGDSSSATAAAAQSQQPPTSQPNDRIASRLSRFTARANQGLPSEFVPEELGSLYVSSRTESLERAERDTRPL